jgi:hypothetical protein
MSELTTSDVLAMTKTNDGNGIFGGNATGFLIILILFFLTGNWGGNNSSVQGALTRAELYDGLNSQNTFSEFRSLQNEVTNGFSNVSQNLCSGFSGVNQSINNALATSTLAMNNGFNGVQSAIADSNYRMADCCCQIKSAIHDEGEQTRALIQANTIQDLRDKVADKDREILSAGITASQLLQTNTLENYFRNLVNGSCSA